MTSSPYWGLKKYSMSRGLEMVVDNPVRGAHKHCFAGSSKPAPTRMDIWALPEDGWIAVEITAFA